MDFLSAPEVAKLYSIPLRTIQNACATGVLPNRTWGKFYVIEPDAAKKYAEGWRERQNGHADQRRNGSVNH